MTKRLVIVFVLFMVILAFPNGRSEAVFDCLKLNSDSGQSDRDYCQNELAKIEAELATLLEKQKEQQKNTGTLAGDVNYLNAQISALKTKVKARGLAIAQLKVSITEKTSKIESLQEKIEKQHTSIAQLLRNTNDFDNENIVHLILSDENLSDFYSDLESYASIKQAVKVSVEQIRGVKTETEVQKSDLQKKQNAETDAKAELESAQKKVAQTEAEKKELLAASKQSEAALKKLHDEKLVQANRIRAALFPLAGISQKIDFGTALAFANEAKANLGIEPAFLLAILTQESNLGANVGLCYLTNPSTGEGVGKNTGAPFQKVMSPTRDVPPFLEITTALKINAFQTAVSCPILSAGGYGGAMGPAQFIRSTWKLFATRLQTALGHYANPWSPEDSFMASSLYLTDLGAIGTSQSAQNIAACRYYGSGLDKTGKYKNISCTYSRNVAALKAKIQANIDLL